MADKKEWKVFIGVPGEDIEGLQSAYGPESNIKSQYTVKSEEKPTEDDIYATFPWAEERGYKVRVEEPGIFDKDIPAWQKGLEAFGVFGNEALSLPTFGASTLVRRATEAAFDDSDRPFSEKMKEASEIENYMEKQHPTASMLGTGLGFAGSLRYNPFGAVYGGASKLAGSVTPKIVQKVTPAVVKGALKVGARGVAPGVAFTTTGSLSEGRLPSEGELETSGAASLATDLALRGAGKLVSKIPGVDDALYSVSKRLGAKLPASKRTVKGMDLAQRVTGLRDRDLFNSTILSNHPQFGLTGTDSPLYAGTGGTTNTLLATIRASNTKAANSLAKRVKADIDVNEKALDKAYKEYLHSGTGIGSPDNIAYRQRALNDKYSGFTESIDTLNGKPLMIRVTKSADPAAATAAEADFLEELNRMYGAGELRFGLDFDPQSGTATPSAIMTAVGNITKNGSLYTRARQQAAADAGLAAIDRNIKYISKGTPKGLVPQWSEDHRALFRDAEEFASGREAAASGRRDLQTFVNETKPEVLKLGKKDPSLAKKAQQNAVLARRAGILSASLDNRGVAVPEGHMPPRIYPENKAVLNLLNSSEKGQKLAEAMRLRDSLASAYNILTNPKIKPAPVAKNVISRLVRAITGKTGTYAMQNVNLTGVDIGYALANASEGSKLASFMRKPVSKYIKMADTDAALKKAAGEAYDALISAAAGLSGRKASKSKAAKELEDNLKKMLGRGVSATFEGNKEE